MYFTRKHFFIVTFFLLSIKAYSQTPAYRWEPGISISKRLTNKWQANGQFKARIRANNYGEQQWNPKLLMIDARGYLTYTLFNQSKLTIGYLTRTNNPLEEDSNEKRIIEQYAFFSQINKYRYTHKITLEQRMREINYIGRLRYALSFDFPLNGEKLDKQEMYFYSKVGMLYSFNSYTQGLENRAALGIGRMLKSGHRFQLDLESRLSGLMNWNDRSLALQFNTVYYISY
jgi:hypothetical protein